MARTTVPLTPDLLEAVHTPCDDCLFWEHPPMHRDGLEPAQTRHAKREWIREVTDEWGPCGRVALIDDEPVGVLRYAPAVFVPGASAFPTAPVSGDAVLLVSAWLDPRHDSDGTGRMLIQAMARDLINHGDVRAVEAFARTGPSDRGHGPRGECVIGTDFLTRVGFTVQRAHPRNPRMRMDLRSVVTWRDELGAAWARLRAVVRRPHQSPAPAARDCAHPR